LHCVDRVSLVTWTGNIGSQKLSESMHRFQRSRIILKAHWCTASLLEWMRDSCELFQDALQELDLREALVCKHDVDLPAVFARYQRLTHLRLVHVGKAALEQCLAACTKRISHLDISCNRFDHTQQMLGISSRLTEFTNLVHLDISHNTFEAPTLQHLSSVLNDCRLLHLNLDCIGLGPEGIATIAPALATCTVLTHLNLARNKIRAPGARSLSAALRTMKRLRHLDLFGNELAVLNREAERAPEYGPDCERLWQSLPECTALATLDLSKNALSRGGKAGMAVLGDALRQCGELTKVVLSNNVDGLYVQDGPWEGLSDGLGECAALKHVNLSHNAINKAGAAALGSAVGKLTTLQSLDASHMPSLCSDCLLCLTSGLATCPGLTSLDLAQTGAEPKVWLEVAERLAPCSALTRLSVRDNQVGAEGARGLAAVLSVSQKLAVVDAASTVFGRKVAAVVVGSQALTGIDLSWNLLKDPGSTQLGEALAGSPFLEVLVLFNNEIGPEGATALALGLQSCTALKRLGLHRNQVGAEGAAALGSCMGSMTHLLLGSNMIQGEGVEKMLQVFGSGEQLTHLNLKGNLLEKKDVEAMAAGMKKGMWRRLKRLGLASHRIDAADREQLKIQGVLDQIRSHCVALRHLDLGQPQGKGLWGGNDVEKGGPGGFAALFTV